MGFYDDYKYGTDGDGWANFWKYIAVLIAVILLIFALSQCSKPSTDVPVSENNRVENSEYVSGTYLDFKTISDDLVYDAATNIVYVENDTADTYDVYVPYIAPNGLPFKYNGKTGELEQIDPREWFVEDNTQIVEKME